MDLSNILAIAGKPDISQLISQTKGGAVVKNLVSGQKYTVFRNDRISSLGEIRIFTESDDRPLSDVLEAIYAALEAKPTPFDPKKAPSDEMFALLAKALPDYDRVRVHASDVKKLFSWYNILLADGRFTAADDEKPAAESPAADAAESPADK